MDGAVFFLYTGTISRVLMGTMIDTLSFLKNKQKKQGFSLIEVMIVVTILAVLFIIAAAMLGTQMAKGRDARRKTDLEKIKKAFEDYASDRSQYPPIGILNNCGDASATALSGYLTEIPCDPYDNSPYLYVPFPDFTDTTGGFRVYAQLEVDTDPVIGTLGCNLGIGCGIPATIVASPEEYNYGVSEGVPVYYTGGDTQIPTQGICCPQGNTACNITQLVGGACPNNPPVAPWPDLASCIANTPCTQ